MKELKKEVRDAISEGMEDLYRELPDIHDKYNETMSVEDQLDFCTDMILKRVHPRVLSLMPKVPPLPEIEGSIGVVEGDYYVRGEIQWKYNGTEWEAIAAKPTPACTEATDTESLQGKCCGGMSDGCKAKVEEEETDDKETE